ncbi:MAG: PTS transporter subunit EIIB, partial [Erysipelotrichaceae bacterium]|nr:PTS transporter subunit EIIB [Erysipelotrichaceae bacterium]
MDYKKTAAQIIELVGGKENIEAHTHCMTRLRLGLKDKSKANEEALKKLPGIQGVVYKGGQYQIVIGPDVEQLYNELAPMVPNAEAQEKVQENLDAEKESIGNRILSYISGSVTPALPVLIGSGMISAILALCANLLKVDTAGTTYQLFNTLANAAYTYLPV